MIADSQSISQSPTLQSSPSHKTSLPAVEITVAVISIVSIALHLVLRFWTGPEAIAFRDLPLYVALAASAPLMWRLLRRIVRLEMTADLLAGVSIVAAIALEEYLAGTIVVLMMATGQMLEALAIRRASFAVDALAKRLPLAAHLKAGTDMPISEVRIGDEIVIYPHEISPVDGVVIDGHSTMNEAYLTGEPFVVPKAVGSGVLSGAINGAGLLTVRAERLAVDSRYSRIMDVMRDAEERRPQIRRLGDRIGAVYTAVIMAFAIATWLITGAPDRFLSILVVATPCPLIIGIPVAVIGSVSLAARRAIIVKDPGILERLEKCTVAIFDKTGTLTYGEPKLVEMITAEPYSTDDVIRRVASLERYSRHPLAAAILAAANERALSLSVPEKVSERPGRGLTGTVDGQTVEVTGRKLLVENHRDLTDRLPESTGGLECIVLVDDAYAATLRFRDAPREDGRSFITHLRPRHGIERVLLVSGDRLNEVEYLARSVGITEVFASQTPEQKLDLVRRETTNADTVFMGDGINDAPALAAATVGIAFGQTSDVTGEAASAVILDNSLSRVDELFHIGRHMRRVALQSSVGGIALSLVGVGFAAAGLLPPVAGAITQEIVDVLAILNAIRATFAPSVLSDTHSS